MKFLSLAVFASAVMGQASVISDAISNIQSKTEALDSAVNSFSGPNDITALQNAATAVIDAINQGNTNVMGIDMIDSTAALTLIDPINALASTVDTAVNDLIAKKSALADETDVVNMNLNQILDATNTFSSTTYSKIPTGLQTTAMNLVQPIIDDLNRAINNFPAGTGGSGPTTTGMTGPTTTGMSGATTTPMVSSAPVYPTGSSTPTTIITSGTGSIVVPPTSVSPPITSESATPPPYNPNGASQLTGGFAAVVVAAAVAVAAF